MQVGVAARYDGVHVMLGYFEDRNGNDVEVILVETNL